MGKTEKRKKGGGGPGKKEADLTWEHPVRKKRERPNIVGRQNQPRSKRQTNPCRGQCWGESRGKSVVASPLTLVRRHPKKGERQAGQATDPVTKEEVKRERGR